MLLDNELELIRKNVILEANTASLVASDIESSNHLIGDLIGRVYQKSIINQVLDTQPCIGPSGVVFYTKTTKTVDSVTQIPTFKKAVMKSPSFTVDTEKNFSIYNSEYINDLQSQFGKDGVQLLTKTIFQELKDQIDQKFIKQLYLSAAAKGTISFTSTNPVLDDLFKVIHKVNQSSLQIAKDTRRGYGSFVIASPNVAAALMTTGLAGFIADQDERNRDLIGYIGKTPVFMDIYNDVSPNEEYFIVSHKGVSTGDSSYIFCPYNIDVVIADTYSVEEAKMLGLARYKIVQNPTDVIGDGNSIFSHKYIVDFTALDQ